MRFASKKRVWFHSILLTHCYRFALRRLLLREQSRHPDRRCDPQGRRQTDRKRVAAAATPPGITFTLDVWRRGAVT